MSQSNDNVTLVVLRGDLGVPWPYQIFGWPPACSTLSFLLHFTFKFVSLTYTADNFQPAKL